MALSLAEETRDFSTAGSNRICINGRNKENKYDDGTPKSAGKICALARLICHGSG